MLEMNEQGLYNFHETVFKPIYADLVAVCANKPEQIAFELEAALSHIAVAKVNSDDCNIYQTNIHKAYGHLQRAALDAAKIMWLEYKRQAKEIVFDEDIRTLACNASEHELLKQYKNAEKLAKKARVNELANVGQRPSESIDLYYEAAKAFSKILGLIDPSKVSKLSRFKNKIKRKEIIISFLVGLISSGIISSIFVLF